MKKIINTMLALALAAFTFSSCSDVPEPYSQPVANPEAVATGTGTLADPFNCVAANAAAKKLGSGGTSTDNYYIKGIVSSVKSNYGSDSYGSATFYISDDGTTNNQFYVYRAYYLNNVKYTSGDLPAVGDTVIICGKITNYNGTYETSQNAAYLYSLNGKGGSTTPVTPGVASGTGTQTDPYNAVAITNIAKKLATGETSTDTYYFKGKVVSIKENYTTQYGNAAFYISDDGTSSNEFYVYRALYLENAKYTSGDVLKEGDDVIVCGKITNYNGTYETVQNGAYLYSLNGVTKGSGSGDTGGTTTTSNMTRTVADNVVTLTDASKTATTNITADIATFGYTDKQVIDGQSYTLTDGTKISFSKGEGSSAPTFYTATKGARIYANNVITIVGAKKIAKVIITCDAYNGTTYIGNETLYGSNSGNTLTIVNKNTTSTGGTQLRAQTIQIFYAE
jgi:hypothetical protein